MNFSYRLLGSVIEKVTGQPYLQYVESMRKPQVYQIAKMAAAMAFGNSN
ncbi:MAG: hypothetical protein IT342_13750 [Candidatus Melainabacteria bacterium]|nr:hypothetical protein [Candidatus Melainabacteria bacterium]